MSYSPIDYNAIDVDMGSGHSPVVYHTIIADMDVAQGAEHGAPVNDTVTGLPVIDTLAVHITFGIVDPIGVITGAPGIPTFIATNIGEPMDDVIAGNPVIGILTVTTISAEVDDTYTGNVVINELIAYSLYGLAVPSNIYTGNPVVDSIIGTAIGAIPETVVTGNPVIPTITVYNPAVSLIGVTTGQPSIPVITAIQTYAIASITDVLTNEPIVPTILCEIIRGYPETIVTGTPTIPLISPVFYPLATENSRLIYVCTLTGTTDLELPISSFQGRLRSGSNTYLSIVIPGITLASEIADRADGQLIIEVAYLFNGEVRQRTEIIRVNLEDIRIYNGKDSKSITLVGYRQETYTPKEVDLENATYYAITNGEYRYRFATPNLELNPGDTVNIGEDSFVANVISYYVSVTEGLAETRMEVSES